MDIALIILLYLVVGLTITIQYWNNNIVRDKLISAIMMALFWPLVLLVVLWEFDE